MASWEHFYAIWPLFRLHHLVYFIVYNLFVFLPFCAENAWVSFCSCYFYGVYLINFLCDSEWERERDRKKIMCLWEQLKSRHTPLQFVQPIKITRGYDKMSVCVSTWAKIKMITFTNGYAAIYWAFSFQTRLKFHFIYLKLLWNSLSGIAPFSFSSEELNNKLQSKKQVHFV